MRGIPSMRDRWVLPVIAGVVAAIAAARAPAMPIRLPGMQPIAMARDSSDGNALRLRRAAAEQRLGNLRVVVVLLEPIDFTRPPAFDGSDRAAFLLGHAYLELGNRARFERLARQVAGWNQPGPWTNWLARQLKLVEAEADAGAAPARLAESGVSASPALGHWVGSNAAPGDTAQPQPELEAMSTLDTLTALGRDLAGAALIRRATRALERGEDARALLEQVPAGSRYAARARHMLGMLQLERGDVEAGRATLGALAASDSSYTGQREVLTALAGRAMDTSDWVSARELYERIDRNWHQESDTLHYRLDYMDYEPVWRGWESGPGPSSAIVLDAAPAKQWTERLARAATNLTAPPSLPTPSLDAPRFAPAPRWQVPPPPPEVWSALTTSARRVDEARDELARADAVVAEVRRLIAERTRYLERGFVQAHDSATRLEAMMANLDSLRRHIDALDRRLKAVRDESTRHILARADTILAHTQDQLRWMSAMRHFHIDGPTPKRPLDVPDGYPSPDSVLAAEENLAHSVAASVESLAAQAPALIGRSYERAWRPGMIDRAAAQSGAGAQTLAWARRVAVSIDSCMTAAARPDSLRRLMAHAAVLAHIEDSLTAVHQALRQRVVQTALERAIAKLTVEREGIDYGLAASAYGMSVKFDRSDSAVTTDPNDTTVTITEDPEAVRWRATAIQALDAFLKAHPQSFARGEMRFRLADLVLVDARQTFREKMARFVREQSKPGAATAVVPTMDASRALDIYRRILREDRDFAHLDAVLFDAGMILADAADPEAITMFQQLVASYPTSRYCQEAYVRMGDVGFTDHRYAECIPYYEHAAQGADTTLRAIALYKLGWSRFSLDRFVEAADAFRQILDLYVAGGRVDRRVNLEDEAEAYLVHTLARAGGASAFAQYFDKIGPRPYETRLLRALGQHFRRYSLYAQAAEADKLLLLRHPLEPDALVSVQRMIETYQRWDRPGEEQTARLQFAPQFAPGGTWYQAQTSDSARTAGAEFARASWTSVARRHHLDARKTGSRADYQEALKLYETVLSKWPDDAQAPSLELQAGEVSAQLGDYSRSLRHYDAAAKRGVDSVATLALWQRVAVTDAWYQTTLSPTARAAAPAGDSLAHAVITAADELLQRFPNHPRATDLMWRQGNLAFGHGWYDRAAEDFGRLADRRPDDRRAPVAASLRADALFRLNRFGDAGDAYQKALETARRAGVDSLAKRAAQAIPVSYFRAAEAAVAADSTAYAKHAALFEKVASGYPGYEHADLARYRAGLAWLKAGQPSEATRLMRALVSDFPRSEFVRDAQLEIGKIAESQGQNEQAARAYSDFAVRFPADAQAGNATLKAADLFARAGQVARADTLRIDYMHKHPEDIPTAMQLLEEMSRRELATVNADRPISTLLPAPPPPVKRVKGRRTPAPVRRAPSGPPSRLSDYMARAEAFPKLASRVLIAQVRFLQGEEASTPYRAAILRQPLDKSIPVKQKLLDAALARYRQSVDLGDSEWAHASTYRIGQSLVAFGDALEQSDRPADLKGEDLVAYNEILANQARVFYGRGEDVWADLLRQKQKEAPNEPWIKQAQTSLWQRLGGRFRFRTEAEVPLVNGTPPSSESSDSIDPPPSKPTTARMRRNAREADVQALQEKAP